MGLTFVVEKRERRKSKSFRRLPKHLFEFRNKLNWETYTHFARFLFGWEKEQLDHITLDFRKTTAAYPECIVPVICRLSKRRAQGLKVEILPAEIPYVNSIFEKNGWYHFLDPETYSATEWNVRRRYNLQNFTSDEELNDTVSYLTKALLQSTELGTGVPEAFEWMANELAGNVLVHAETSLGWVYASVHPEKKLLTIVVVDDGIGIPTSMQKAFPGLTTDLEAMELAIRKEVTSKPEAQG